jgi:hypothetical protein
MELHPDKVGDLSAIPEALKQYGFDFIAMDQDGQPAAINSAIFLVASSNPAVAVIIR